MTRDYHTKPVSTAGALAPRYCRCDRPIVDNGHCWKCGHPLPPSPLPWPTRRPEPGPAEVNVDPSWEQMARVLEGGQ